jgi:Zn-dependent M28 family amino/carboxypeptidase
MLRRMLSKMCLFIVATLIAAVAWLFFAVSRPVFLSAPIVTKSALIGADLPAKLRAHVETLVHAFHPRDHTNLTRLDQTSEYIQKHLIAVTPNVEFQTYAVSGKNYRNVIARFGPDTADVIVIGAHYDVFDKLPGADDNASGVAGLIELAHALRDAKLTQRVELVAYTLEEPPYFRTSNMGSAVHARSLKAANKRVSLMLSLECIGYFSDEPESQDLPSPIMKLMYPTTGNFIALVGHYRDGALSKRVKEVMANATVLPVYSINAPAIVAGIDFSDHLNYWNEGFVGMMVTDTAFLRNKNYHTANDTPEKLDYKRMALVVEAVAAVVKVEAGEVAAR